MASFSAQEYGEMIMCYGEARGNAREALRIYVERYPDRRHPSDSRIITTWKATSCARTPRQPPGTSRMRKHLPQRINLRCAPVWENRTQVRGGGRSTTRCAARPRDLKMVAIHCVGGDKTN
ncbi:hypothetical protein EVAR_102819_1 [Eumeta japonica]|uniref:DUF4817 domain-containing protein n=1 Tax=Eumeta variegata TaxID=151549 RepID=A0A4C1TJ95_EUMVA|nr:hypothetical protein EVAR_102819_1 [Eumeta japonica]